MPLMAEAQEVNKTQPQKHLQQWVLTARNEDASPTMGKPEIWALWDKHPVSSGSRSPVPGCLGIWDGVGAGDRDLGARLSLQRRASLLEGAAVSVSWWQWQSQKETQARRSCLSRERMTIWDTGRDLITFSMTSLSFPAVMLVSPRVQRLQTRALHSALC